ncbi:MAG: cupin domain-containing protein [Saprospiraceae bacterium]|nr:cupin domain-containing protein [Saprospiraceae bacterium]
MEVINLNDKFGLFDQHWNPKIIGELNGQHVKIAKLKGEFVWHAHKEEDEMFLIIKGTLKIEFRDKTRILREGEMCIIPKGVEHNPIAEEEVWVMLFEPASTKHTGEVDHELTVKNYERL